jgi:hypothetical protein
VADLRLSPPPDLGPGARYSEYRGWLHDNFYRDICSYCLLQYPGSLSIDHYVPRSFEPSRIDHPDNLLLSCATCGRQKWDYHPDHHGRRRLPHDRTGFLILDVRVEDLACIFEVGYDGSLVLRPDLDELGLERACWNVALLRLDLYDAWRKRVLEKLHLVEDLRATVGDEPSERTARVLSILELELAERLPMLRAFDVAISPALRERLEALAAQGRDSARSG